jgi:hypothetical protein
MLMMCSLYVLLAMLLIFAFWQSWRDISAEERRRTVLNQTAPVETEPFDDR